MKNKSSAFSLIELSIVILIIGVLIAGVTQASRLVRQSKLTTAQTLTQSSPVNSLKGLVLWLEPTMAASFIDSQEVDTTALTYWYDINPQATISRAFVPTTSSLTTYKLSSTNSLPAVAFTGASGSDMHGNNSDYLSTPDNAYTFFVVAKSTSTAAQNTIFYNGTWSATVPTGFGLSLTITNAYHLIHNGSTAASTSGYFDPITASTQGTSATVAQIISGTITPSMSLGAIATQTASTWKNGVATSIAASSFVTATSMVIPTSNFFIGNTNASAGGSTGFIGEISEIIVFDNVLKKTDRQEIEKYLSKKYAIAITQN